MDNDPFAETRRLIAEWDRVNNASDPIGHRIQPLDLLALRDMSFNYDWLVEKWWPVETHLHIFAAPKTGKSLLMLWVAANLALGRDAFTQQPIKRHRVAYVDNEMTLRDVQSRLEDMEMPFEELAGWLMYFPYPALAPMDTPAGGLETIDLVREYECDVLILDTLSRVVKGEENSNDTYRNFYNHTGRLLKADAIAMGRLDHAGHDASKSRGASAKADDVDLVYGLEKRSGKDESQGYRLKRTHARIADVSETIDLELTDYPVTVKSTGARLWNQHAIAKAKELDEIGAPIGVSQREAHRLLREAGRQVGKNTYLCEALRLRIDRAPFREFGL